jgi:hypothetical protein
LANFSCTAIDLPGFAFDGHGEPINAIFELTCGCGGKSFTVLAHVEDGDSIPPVELECSSCNSTYVVFDPREHGYDAVIGNYGSYEVDELVQELTPDTLLAPHGVIVRLEYPSDVLGDAALSADDLEPQDLFSWITILARDPTSGTLATVFDDECS